MFTKLFTRTVYVDKQSINWRVYHWVCI